MADGRLLAGGGIQGYQQEFAGIHHDHAPGLRSTWIFDPNTSRWTQGIDMNEGPLRPPLNPRDTPDPTKTGGRWYPTLVTLESGEILAMSGHPGSDDARHHNNTPEIFTTFPPPEGKWRLKKEAGDPGIGPVGFDANVIGGYYPRLYVLPTGKVFLVTPQVAPDLNIGTCQLYDPFDGELTDVCALPVGYNLPERTSVLLPLLPEEGYKPRILVCGQQEAYTLTLPFRIDASAPPNWTATAPRTLPGSPDRIHVSSVLLPTGDVLVCGGIRESVDAQGNVLHLDRNAVLQAELYQPAVDAQTGEEAGQWLTLPAAHIPRNYHSVALLMPDGRVWTGGSNVDNIIGAATAQHYIEIFEPWYYAVTRPKITASPPNVVIREQFETQYDSAQPIKTIAIIRTGSATHSFNSDQRYVVLQFSQVASNRLLVVGPPNGSIAPPGYYLLFVVDDSGVPSPGVFLRIDLPPSLRQALHARGIEGGGGIRTLGFNSVRTLMGI
jgi:hypothetical protein